MTNQRGAWLDLPHPASQKGHNGLVHLSQIPLEGCWEEPKPPRYLHSHQLHLPLRPFNDAQLLQVLDNTFSKEFGWSLEEVESPGGKEAQAEVMQGTKEQHDKGGPTQEMRRPCCSVEKQRFSATCL